MKNLMLGTVTFNDSLINFTQWCDVNTKLIQMNELFISFYQETSAWRFPKLKALVTEHSIFIFSFRLRNIENRDIVSIQIDCFIRQN